MSELYLIKKMQSLGFSKTLSDQINVFTITDESTGAVLDYNHNITFLDYFLTKNPDVVVNNFNEIPLTQEEFFIYMGMKMYYYNPRILDSVIYSLLNPIIWYDAGDSLCRVINIDTAACDLLLSKGVNLSQGYRATPYGSSEGLATGVKLSNDNALPFLRNGNEFDGFELNSEITIPPINQQDPFSICFAVMPDSTSDYFLIYHVNYESVVRYMKIGCYYSGTTFHVVIITRDDASSENSYDFTATIDPTTIQSVNINWSGNLFSVWINDEDVQTQSFSNVSSNTYPSKCLFCCTEDSNAFTGYLFDLIISENQIDSAKSYNIRDYFKIKYFLV